jgi:hypothetical protein
MFTRSATQRGRNASMLRVDSHKRPEYTGRATNHTHRMRPFDPPPQACGRCARLAGNAHGAMPPASTGTLYAMGPPGPVHRARRRTCAHERRCPEATVRVPLLAQQRETSNGMGMGQLCHSFPAFKQGLAGQFSVRGNHAYRVSDR